ncbi:MAG: flippase [Candidatus Sumerlaeia bacterium]|nr:flippase [Candidatus Sumerlaeia bacterium]
MTEPVPAPPETSGRIIARNSAWLLGSNLLGKVLTVVFLAVAANRLEADAYGKFQFVLALGGFFHIALDWGYATLMIERGSKDRGDLARHYSGNLGLRTLTYPSSLLLYAAAVAALGASGLGAGMFRADLPTMGIFLLAFGVVIVHGHFYLQRGALMALERFSPIAAGETTERVVFFALGLAALFAFGSLGPFLLVCLLAPLAKCLVLEAALRRAGMRGSWRPDGAFLRRHWRDALPHALYAVAGMLMYRVDQVMIGLIRGSAEVGLYSVAYDKVFGLVLLGQMVSNALTPTASRNFAADRGEFQRIFRRAFFLLPVLAMPMTAGLALTAPGVMDLFHTDEYSGAWRALAWLSPFILFRFWSFLYAAVLLAAGRIKYHLYAESLGVAVKIAMNLALVPEHGYLGAAVSVAVAELVVLLADAWFAKRIGLPFLPLGDCAAPAAATALMALGVWLAAPLGVFAQVGVGGALYAAGALAFRIHRREPAIGRALAAIPFVGAFFR